MNSGTSIILQHSKLLERWILILAGFALFCAFYALPLMVALALVPIVLFYSRYCLQQHAWRNSQNAIVAMHCLNHNEYWTLHTTTQRWRVRYQGIAFRSTYLCIAVFTRLKDQRSFTVLIPQDAVIPQQYTPLLAKLWF